jgi:hypothetical protein
MRFLIIFLFAVSARAETSLHLDDPAILQNLEKQGFDFARLATAAAAAQDDNKQLHAASESYRAIVDALQGDLDEAKRVDPTLSPSIGSAHRMLNVAWLKSPLALYELVGVVSRLDRAPFQAKTCGETRFIYRLAYRTKSTPPIYSRLPFTFNVVFWASADEKCANAAKTWEKFTAAVGKGEAVTKASLGLGALKSIEVNLQTVRWPSTVRPDMGGYAEYVQRVFKIVDGKLKPAKLENTPDAARIAGDARLKEKLLAWITNPANLKEIDAGVALLPEEFLATRALSVALNGTHRLANAPFTRVFSEADLRAVSYAGLETVKSPAGLLRRLNDLSCMGCHQGRTVAGFHFLGRDRGDTDAVNAIHVASSPHFLLDQQRRRAFFDKVARGETPVARRPLSVRADRGEGGFGSHCGMGDPSFAAWDCKPGYICRKGIDDYRVSATGTCMPKGSSAGALCFPGTMKHDANPQRDRVTPLAVVPCRDGQFCETVRVGFPGGMCSGGCAVLKSGETCGSIAVLQGFNACLARAKESFSECLRANVRPGALRGCSETEFCRDDYICTRTAAGKGACIPPYFLFQLRVDGHPKP